MAAHQTHYYAPLEDLPAPLPSKADIHQSTDVLCDQGARRVVGVGAHYIAKYGPGIDLDEGRDMLFISQQSSVPVSKIYALYRDPADCHSYIIMERIPGEPLSLLWPRLDCGEKLHIMNQIKVSFDELRSLPSPGGYCSLDRKPLRDHLFYTGPDEASLKLEGPFDTETELNDALIKKYASSRVSSGKTGLYLRSFPSVLSGHPPTFTHGDLQRKNIMVRKESNEVSIIDWEFSGWYPSYWEYARAIFACGRFEDDWSEWVDSTLTCYRNEWVWMQMLIVELWS